MSGAKKRLATKRPSGPDGGARPAAKRLRAGLAEEEQKDLGLTSEQVQLLEKDEDAVKKFKLADVQHWVEAVLKAGGLEGSAEAKRSGVGRVVTVLKKQQVTGAALVNLTLEKLLKAPCSLAGGSAKLLAMRIERLRAEVGQVTAKDLDITACVRPADVNVERAGLVKLAESVASCMSEINLRLPQQTDASDLRVPPTMLSRCMRGGKTTVLCKVFDELKKNGKNPIFISFNCDAMIHRLARESPLDTILRAIAVALMKTKPKNTGEANAVQCKEESLTNFLEGKENVVLLVDELNVLLKPSDTEDYGDVGLFLRQTFLDPASRHLMFSTHVPTSAGIDRLLGKGAGSSRDAVAIAMPKSHDMNELRSMADKCTALTPCEAAYYSYIPSLMYTVKTQPSYDFKERFRDISKPTASAELLTYFLTEFFNGVRLDNHSPIRAFDSLTESPAIGQVRWVLGYAGLMCAHLGLDEVAEQIGNLAVEGGKVGSGKNWEHITDIALALRCFQAMHRDAHPLLGLPEGTKPRTVRIVKVPNEHRTTESVLEWWGRERKRRVVEQPCLALLRPTNDQFEVFDSLVVCHTEASGAPYSVRGYQNKLSKRFPMKHAPEGTFGVLLRGDAPKKSIGPKKFERWQYLDRQAIIDFLGKSLEAVYPATWPA